MANIEGVLQVELWPLFQIALDVLAGKVIETCFGVYAWVTHALLEDLPKIKLVNMSTTKKLTYKTDQSSASDICPKHECWNEFLIETVATGGCVS
jgi:hypothetical protein